MREKFWKIIDSPAYEYKKVCYLTSNTDRYLKMS